MTTSTSRPRTSRPRRRCRGLAASIAAIAASLLVASGPAVAAEPPVVATSTPSPLTAPTATPAQSPSGSMSSAAQAVTWGVTPSSADGPDGRSTFTYTNLPAGSVVRDYVGVANYGDAPVTFSVHASDAINTAVGGFDLLPNAQKPIDVGSWVTLSAPSVTVPARSRVNLPFTLSIPANATPGDHFGGIVATLSSEVTDADGSTVNVDRRLGARIYLRVAGVLHPALQVDGLHVTYHTGLNPFAGGAASVDYVVRNTGNVALSGAQQVTVSGLFGATLAHVHPQALTVLLPGQSQRVSVSLSGVFPAGPLTVKTRISPTAATGPALSPPPAVATASTGLWAWPWPQFVFLLVLVALGWGMLRLRRSRRARNEAALAAAVERGRHEALRVTTGVETSIDLTSPERTGVIDLNAGDSAHVDAGRGDGAEKRSR